MKALLFFCIFISFAEVNGEPFLEGFDYESDHTFPYQKPSLRFLEKVSYSEVESTLKRQGVKLKQREFYFAVIDQEERGYIGYTASSHVFRVFQDIIRMTLEEVMGLEFKKDFHFFRVPGDPLVNDHYDVEDFLNRFKKINDNKSKQRDQLISTNFSIFNNYEEKYECSAVFFENSIMYKPPCFNTKIARFFRELGMPIKDIKHLFEIGDMIENRAGSTLYQIFDFSHHDSYNNRSYEFIDKYGYPCVKKGVPKYTNKSLSELYVGTDESIFLPQYRIIISHEGILNPYSSVSIRRYDLNNQWVVKKYEEKLRTAIRKIPFDHYKASLYKRKLQEQWDCYD